MFNNSVHATNQLADKAYYAHCITSSQRDIFKEAARITDEIGDNLDLLNAEMILPIGGTVPHYITVLASTIANVARLCILINIKKETEINSEEHSLNMMRDLIRSNSIFGGVYAISGVAVRTFRNMVSFYTPMVMSPLTLSICGLVYNINRISNFAKKYFSILQSFVRSNYPHVYKTLTDISASFSDYITSSSTVKGISNSFMMVEKKVTELALCCFIRIVNSVVPAVLPAAVWFNKQILSPVWLAANPFFEKHFIDPFAKLAIKMQPFFSAENVVAAYKFYKQGIAQIQNVSNSITSLFWSVMQLPNTIAHGIKASFTFLATPIKIQFNHAVDFVCSVAASVKTTYISSPVPISSQSFQEATV